ncbi:MAG: methylmalonyl Co-A mutase-associated GTPase MeaB [Bacteroidota bacterium]|jgi:LAO/AO transport system kinase|nr:methylmalonyl Co-A mutase-associated GTPase MeaB [Bacteroidota bacterium]
MSIIPTPENLALGHERAIARAISWVENQHPGALELLEQLQGRTPIIGITGPPGAGKSSLVNALALHWSAQNLRTAIVAVDPSSPFNLGSLLGDRLRMPGLFLDPKVYIRSVSARGSLGGLCASIIEICDVLKQARFDHIIVETVGVGQSEIEIAGIADTTVVVTVPESGDEVQTLKSGIMEIADIFVVNKSDREGADAFANHLKKLAHYRMGDGAWEAPVVNTVAMEGTGIQALSEAIISHQTQGISNHRKLHLLAEKAYRLIQRNRMQDISLSDLRNQIAENQTTEEFNLYRFTKKFA